MIDLSALSLFYFYYIRYECLLSDPYNVVNNYLQRHVTNTSTDTCLCFSRRGSLDGVGGKKGTGKKSTVIKVQEKKVIN